MALNFEGSSIDTIYVAGGIHPSQRPLLVTGKREDGYISEIEPSPGNVSRLNLILSGDPAPTRKDVTPISVSHLNTGDFLYVNITGKPPMRGTFIRSHAVGDLTAIEVDISPASHIVDATQTGFINFLQNYYVEVRYLDKNDNPIINYPDRFYAGLDGNVIMDISTPSSLITPSLEGKGAYLSILYKAEYRESYDRNRDGDWQSLPFWHNFELAHGSDEQIKTGFTDIHIPKRFVYGYPLIYSYIVNPYTAKSFREVDIEYTELTLQQTNPYPATVANKKTVLSVDFTETGQRVFVFEISGIHKDTVFIKFSESFS